MGSSDGGVVRIYVNDKLHELNLKNPDLDLFYVSGYALGYEANEVHSCLKAGRTESELMTHKDSIYLAKIEEQLRKQIGVQYDCDLC